MTLRVGEASSFDDCQGSLTRRVQFSDTVQVEATSPVRKSASLFRALLAAGQIVMRKVDACKRLAEEPSDQIIALTA